MMGIVVHCPNPECNKVLLKDCSIISGSIFKIKCYWCGEFIEIEVIHSKIGLRNLRSGNPIDIIDL